MQESYLIFVFFESLVMWTLNLRGQEKCHYRFKPFFIISSWVEGLTQIIKC